MNDINPEVYMQSIESEPTRRFTVYRNMSTMEYELLSAGQIITREDLIEEDRKPTERELGKLADTFAQYLENRRIDIPDIADNLEFITTSSKIIGVNLDINPEMTLYEIRSSIGQMPDDFHILLQTHSSNPLTKYFSGTFGGVLNRHIPEGNVVVELSIPGISIITDPDMRNRYEKEVLLSHISPEWVVRHFEDSLSLVKGVLANPDLPFNKYSTRLDPQDPDLFEFDRATDEFRAADPTEIIILDREK